MYGAFPFLTQHLSSEDWEKQLQDETRNIEDLGFGVPYVRGLTVVHSDVGKLLTIFVQASVC